MTCPSRRGDTTLLLDYAFGRLARGQAALLAQHASECSDCAATLVEYSSISGALDLWEAPAISTQFNRRLWDRIERAASVTWYMRAAEWFRPRSLKPAIPVAAAALVFAAVFFFDRTVRMANTPTTGGVTAIEADQAERTLDDLQLISQFDAAVDAPRPARRL